jgi:hypothetical protein
MPRELTPEEIDLMIMNEDWLRYVSWDFYVTDEKGRRKLVTTLEDLKKWLGVTDDMPVREQALKIMVYDQWEAAKTVFKGKGT